MAVGLTADFSGEMCGIRRGCSALAVKPQPAVSTCCPVLCAGSAATALLVVMWRREGPT